MSLFWITAMLLYPIVAFLFWKGTVREYKEEYGAKMRNVWGTKVYYWQAVILLGGGITFLIMSLLNLANIMSP